MLQANTYRLFNGGAHGEGTQLGPGLMDHLVHLLDGQDVLGTAPKRFDARLISVSGAHLTELACGFGVSPEQTAARIFDEIARFRDVLIQDLQTLLEAELVPPLGQAVRKLRRLARQSSKT